MSRVADEFSWLQRVQELAQHLELLVVELDLDLVVAQGFLEEVIAWPGLRQTCLGRQHAQRRVFGVGDVGTGRFEFLQAPTGVGCVHGGDCFPQLRVVGRRRSLPTTC